MNLSTALIRNFDLILFGLIFSAFIITAKISKRVPEKQSWFSYLSDVCGILSVISIVELIFLKIPTVSIQDFLLPKTVILATLSIIFYIKSSRYKNVKTGHLGLILGILVLTSLVSIIAYTYSHIRGASLEHDTIPFRPNPNIIN